MRNIAGIVKEAIGKEAAPGGVPEVITTGMLETTPPDLSKDCAFILCFQKPAG